MADIRLTLTRRSHFVSRNPHKTDEALHWTGNDVPQ